MGVPSCGAQGPPSRAAWDVRGRRGRAEQSSCPHFPQCCFGGQIKPRASHTQGGARLGRGTSELVILLQRQWGL